MDPTKLTGPKKNFDSYRNLTQREILKELDISPSYRRFNLPKSERQAIKTLANNDKITIKPVDKGGKIVIQDTTDYINECERQLENTMYYKRLYTDPRAELNLIIKNKLEQGIKDGHISTEEFEVLYNRDPRISNFYTLPKIHKTNNPGRFIDDVFIVWTHGKETLEKFLNYINQAHETIKFTAEYSTQEVPFLDTLVYKLNNKLATKVYHKKTDDKMYLHYSSAHPRSQKDTIPYSLFIRCKRICTENRHFNMEVQEITNKLAHQGYPKELIVKSYLKAKNQDRDNLLKMDEKPNNQKNKIRLITTYNKHNPPMKEILERFKDYFLQNRKGIDFQNIQTVYRRAPNLRDKLVRGQVIKN